MTDTCAKCGREISPDNPNVLATRDGKLYCCMGVGPRMVVVNQGGENVLVPEIIAYAKQHFEE